MATPHVVGVIALTLAEGTFSNAAQVKDYLKRVATRNVITGRLNGAPNYLLYNHVHGGKIPDDQPDIPVPAPKPVPGPKVSGFN